MKNQLRDLFRQLFEMIRALLISPEIMATLLIAFLFLLFPTFFASVGKMLKSDAEFWKYFALIPVALFIWIVKEARLLLFPGEKANSLLTQWPDYWKYKIRVYAAIILSLGATILSIVTWAANKNLTEGVIAMNYLISIAVSFIAASSSWLASIYVKEMIERYPKRIQLSGEDENGNT